MFLRWCCYVLCCCLLFGSFTSNIWAAVLLQPVWQRFHLQIKFTIASSRTLILYRILDSFHIIGPRYFRTMTFFHVWVHKSTFENPSMAGDTLGHSNSSIFKRFYGGETSSNRHKIKFSLSTSNTCRENMFPPIFCNFFVALSFSMNFYYSSWHFNLWNVAKVWSLHLFPRKPPSSLNK